MLAVEKQVGLSRVLSTPCSGKGNICHGTIYSLSNWIMTFVFDEYNVLGGRERNRGRKEKITKKNQAGERRKKQRHPCFGQHFCYPPGAKQKRDSGALGK